MRIEIDHRSVLRTEKKLRGSLRAEYKALAVHLYQARLRHRSTPARRPAWKKAKPSVRAFYRSLARAARFFYLPKLLRVVTVAEPFQVSSEILRDDLVRRQKVIDALREAR